MVINTNTQAQAAASNLSTSQTMLSKSLSRLSSGQKIVTPDDDAAGLAVAMRLDAQVKRLDAARNNVGNAISFSQVQDGFLMRIGKTLDRMSELAILAQDVTKSDADRALYQEEYAQLSSYIGNAADKDFNGVSLFSSSSLDVTIDSEGSTFAMAGVNLDLAGYTDALGASISTRSNAMGALEDVRTAITQLASDRARIGAYQARLNATSAQLSVTRENLSSASSRIQDVNIAEESTQYARYNILVQSGTAMLAQANQMPQSVLRLLQ